MKNVNLNEGTLALDVKEEARLGGEVSAIQTKVGAIVITDAASYEAAADAVKDVKTLSKAVKAFWEPLRKATKAAYDTVIAKRKAMMEPLDSAEAAIKGKMSAYTLEVERKRLAEQEAMRRLAAAEAERKLAQAVATEGLGDLDGAEIALSEAEVMAGVAVNGTIASRKPVANGIAQTKTWKITGVDPSKVPVNFNGVEIRPVDTKAVMRLIKATKGTLQIPGITFEEDVTISVRT